MAGKPGFVDYVKAAFNARPIGMFIAPNWVGLALFSLLGLQEPGFWVLGAGLELAYLSVLATNQRFQRLVHGRSLAHSRQAWEARLDELLRRLGGAERARYAALAARCRSILDLHEHAASESGVDLHDEGLGRLSWMYLRLLLMRQAILRVLQEIRSEPGAVPPRVGDGGHDEGDRLDDQIRALQARVGQSSISEELRHSLQGQIEILEQRRARRSEARQKLAYIDAELSRIEQQVELIREQAVLSTDPETLSARIDDIAATLGGTAQWIRDHQQVYGAMEDLLSEPPPLAVQAGARETQ